MLMVNLKLKPEFVERIKKYGETKKWIKANGKTNISLTIRNIISEVLDEETR